MEEVLERVSVFSTPDECCEAMMDLLNYFDGGLEDGGMDDIDFDEEDVEMENENIEDFVDKIKIFILQK